MLHTLNSHLDSEQIRIFNPNDYCSSHVWLRAKQGLHWQSDTKAMRNWESTRRGRAAGAGYKSASGRKSWIWNLESPSSRSMSMPPILLAVDLQVAKSGFLSPLLSPPLTETTKKVVLPFLFFLTPLLPPGDIVCNNSLIYIDFWNR